MKIFSVLTVCVSVATVAMTGGISAVKAGVLNDVPMQGGMVMPMVSYHESDGRIHVTMPSEIPQLTPLLVSHPGDQFDPADPWFNALDPRQEGAAFSRRYGFAMDGMSDFLPGGTQIWIRKISGSAELKAYRPSTFEPIFGTDGVTNSMYWNTVMFHPIFAAPAGTNRYSATFELYLLDTTTGQEVPESSSGPLLLEWENIPDGRPTLTLAKKIMVRWPADAAANWVMESATAIDSADWKTVTNAPVIVDGEAAVFVDENSNQQFFRMRYVP